MDWSDQQKQALDAVSKWHKVGDEQVYRVFGFAGTGKTTLARHFANEINGDTCFAAFTGKAAMVMRKSGCRGANTIHGTIYSAEQDENTGAVTFVLDRDSKVSDASLVVIDECSMVDSDLGRDLLSFGKPVLVLGDPAQLPPVRGGGFFTDHEPDQMLTEIHRQAEDNPIVKLATDVREGRDLSFGQYGTSQVIAKTDVTPELVKSADQVLVGKNLTRHLYNKRMRELLGRKNGMPEPGDRLVCLKNNRSNGLFNGGLFTISEVHDQPRGAVKDKTIKMDVLSSDFEKKAAIRVDVREEFFLGGHENIDWRELSGTDQFNYGYALTVHKAQGSQWGSVALFDESRAFRSDWRRWLYTGITRAAEKITIVR